MANVEDLLVSMATAMACRMFSCCCESVFFEALEKASYTDTGAQVMSGAVKSA